MTVEKTNMICINCPVGCEMTVTHDGPEVIEIEGNTCRQGIDYVKQELSNPTRTVLTTVRVRNGRHPLVPVRSKSPVPKKTIFPILEKLRDVELEAPVEIHTVVIEDAMDTGVNIVTSRGMPKAK